MKNNHRGIYLNVEMCVLFRPESCPREEIQVNCFITHFKIRFKINNIKLGYTKGNNND
jgi:hypothetical protein